MLLQLARGREFHVVLNCAVDRHLHALPFIEDAGSIACAEVQSWRRVRLVVIGNVLEEYAICARGGDDGEGHCFKLARRRLQTGNVDEDAG